MVGSCVVVFYFGSINVYISVRDVKCFDLIKGLGWQEDMRSTLAASTHWLTWGRMLGDRRKNTEQDLYCRIVTASRRVCIQRCHYRPNCRNVTIDTENVRATFYTSFATRQSIPPIHQKRLFDIFQIGDMVTNKIFRSRTCLEHEIEYL